MKSRPSYKQNRKIRMKNVFNLWSYKIDLMVKEERKKICKFDSLDKKTNN